MECGHTFCYRCLKTWFHDCLRKQVQFHDGVPDHLKILPYTTDMLRELHEREYVFVAQYTCPLCVTPIHQSLIKVSIVRDLISTATDAFGFPVVDDNNNALTTWSDVFYKKTYN